MRLMAKVKKGGTSFARCIIYASDSGVYVFPCETDEDGSAVGDDWYQSLEDAFQACEDEFGIERTDWEDIGDPLPGCQHDWIAPVRVIGGQWGKFERLIDGTWVRFIPKRRSK